MSAPNAATTSASPSTAEFARAWPPIGPPTSGARAWAARSPVSSALCAFVGLSLLTRYPFLDARFLNVDEAAHLLGSSELLRGGALYVDFADNKPPLVYFFYAMAQLLFGPGLGSVRVLAAVALAPATALAASAFFRHDARGVAAGAAFLVASATLLASDGHAVHCEHVMILPLGWSLVVLRAPRFFTQLPRLAGAGALVGLATLAKQPAALCLLGYALLVVVSTPRSEWREGMKRLTALGVGFAAPCAVASAWLFSTGSLEEAVFWVWTYNASHVANPMLLADRAAQLTQLGLVLVPAILPLVLLAVLGHWPFAGTWRDLWRRVASRRSELIWVCFALCVAAPALLGLRLFGHYFVPLLFALAIAAGQCLGLPQLTSDRPRLRVARRATIGVAVIAFVAMTCVSLVVHDPARGVAEVSRPCYERIGLALRDDSPGASLFVWGYAPTLYVHAHARPASRFVVPIDSLTGYLTENGSVLEGRLDVSPRISARQWDQLMADLETTRPNRIVDTAPADLNRWGRFGLDRFPRLGAFVRAHYHVESIVDGVVIYASDEGGSATAPPRSASSGTSPNPG